AERHAVQCFPGGSRGTDLDRSGITKPLLPGAYERSRMLRRGRNARAGVALVRGLERKPVGGIRSRDRTIEARPPAVVPAPAAVERLHETDRGERCPARRCA